jgi:hypothetical protein
MKFMAAKEAALLRNIFERRVKKLYAVKRFQGVECFRKNMDDSHRCGATCDSRKKHLTKESDCFE